MTAPLRSPDAEQSHARRPTKPASVARNACNPRGLRDLPVKVQSADPATKRRAAALYKALEAEYPDAECELTWSQPHELLVATILSAQATDAGVNKATPGLFRAFPTPADYAASTPQAIERHVRTIGLFRQKAKSIHAAMTTLVNEFDGEVPRTVPELLTLRGVARKTAGVVLGHCFGINDVFVVDTHVQRLAYRFGFVSEPKLDPLKVERVLMGAFPRPKWCRATDLFIFHGRRSSPARGWDPKAHPIDRRFAVNA